MELSTITKVSNEDISNNTYEFPKNSRGIGVRAFSNCTNIKTLKIPENISSIDKKAFEDCTSLEQVEIPKSITTIQPETFNNCKNLKIIKLPSTIQKIGYNAFTNCKSLESINIPMGLDIITRNLFSNCESLKSIHLPLTIQDIADNSFSNCKSLTNINIPIFIKSLGHSAFNNCVSLKSIHLPHNVKSIEPYCFLGCTNLNSINLPNNLETLGSSAFSGCSSLKHIIIPKNIEFIDFCTFANCSSLKKVKLNKHLQNIGNSSFVNCSSLEKLNIPDEVSHIGKNSFANCTSLKSVNFSKNLRFIDNGAFSGCSSIETIVLPKNVKDIGKEVFKNCSSLKSIELPYSIQFIGDNAFEGCYSLEKLHIPSSIINMGSLNNPSLKFFIKNELAGGFILSRHPEQNSLPLENLNINLAFLSNNWSYKDVLFKEQTNPNICDFYNNFLTKQSKMNARDFIVSHNFTFFKKFEFDCTSKDYFNFYKLLYNLGAFKKPFVDNNGKTIDYGQKVGEFLLEKVNKQIVSISSLNSIFENMNVNGFNREFTDFFMKEFDDLINAEVEKSGFISNCYNFFDAVQLTNTSNRGSQRQLKPTVRKFKEYFEIGKFENVTNSTEDIARTLSPFFSNQETFDEAVKINEIREKNHIPNNILNTPLNEEISEAKHGPFSKINNITKKIINEQTHSLEHIIFLEDNEFTYEWLEKNDPENFILGKLCSCCAHLEGTGYTIMKASIIHPNVQNLVIKDKDDKIIAKSTLYVNREAGYGVFNNVEIYNKIFDDDKIKIYEKFILGIKRFIEEYNRENPNKPLRQVNVGMHLNDLNYLISKNHEKARNLLEAIDYSDFSCFAHDYAGDSSFNQCIIWKLDENDKIKNTPLSQNINIDENQNNNIIENQNN